MPAVTVAPDNSIASKAAPPPPAEGLLYDPRRRHWPEMTVYAYCQGCHELRLFRHEPSPQEIDLVRCCEIELSLEVSSTAVFLYYRFDAREPWAYVSVSWWRQPEQEQAPPAATLREAKLRVLLVDSGTGLLRAVREVAMHPRLARELHAALRAQARHRFDYLKADTPVLHPDSNEFPHENFCSRSACAVKSLLQYSVEGK